MKIVILYNHVGSLSFGRPEDILADEDTVKTAGAVATAISELGFEYELFNLDQKNVSKLKKLKADFFFNLAEGVGDKPKSEWEVTEILDKIGIPYSGSGPSAMRLTNDKIATKDLLSKHGLLTPHWQVFADHDRLDRSLHFPLIVKPGAEDCSLGISQDSVVKTENDLYRMVRVLQNNYPDAVLVEEYIAGRELNVTVLGNGSKARALPISEITFGKSFVGHYKFVDFAAKWEENSTAYRDTPGTCPARLPKEVTKKVMAASEAAFRLTGCRDYARVDIRLARGNKPYILEVNDNPAIGPGDGAMRSAGATGLTYSQFIARIITEAMGRWRTHSR